MPYTMRGVANSQRSAKFFIYLIIALGALLIRLPYMGDPAPDNDEQLYHLIGLKLLSGSIPYVDLWDRKPFLLFVIYAIGAALGGGSPLGYQVLAACSATVGAIQIFELARRLSDDFAALIGAGLYLLSFQLFFAPVGASEVFYLPLLLGMFQLTVISYERENILLKTSFLAMILGGISIAVKYTALPQAVFFGFAILLRWRKLGMPWPSLAGYAVIFGLLGIAPTALIGFGYAMGGHFDAFIYANFESIFGRGSLSGPIADGFKAVIVSRSFILVIAASLSIIMMILNRSLRNTTYYITIGFLCSGFFAFIMLGNLYVSYFMPVIPGLSLASTPIFTGGIAKRALASAVFLVTLAQADLPGAVNKSNMDRLAIDEIARMLRPFVKRDPSCIYVYDGPTAIYQATGSCLPTRYIYPDHLNNAMERNSIGSDPSIEVRRILRAKPLSIITAATPIVPVRNEETFKIVSDELKGNYKEIGKVYYPYRDLYIYVRRDLVK